MLTWIALLAGASAALAVVAVAELAVARPRALDRRLEELSGRGARGAGAKAPRRSAGERLCALLNEIGAPLARRVRAGSGLRQMLSRAGYRHAEALPLFWGARVAGILSLATLAFIIATAAAAPTRVVGVAMLWLGLLGWALPLLVVRHRVRARQRELLRNLPDALDLLVVCVEAGLGLNQAVARMAEEIRHFSPRTGEEFALVNLEIRAGAPREVALRNLGERTGLEDLRSLATLLVQADRFGTSIGQALRVHSNALREQRRQRAEELAAKTAVKLIFPLVLCIFPTVFVVVLGPALLQMFRALTAP